MQTKRFLAAGGAIAIQEDDGSSYWGKFWKYFLLENVDGSFSNLSVKLSLFSANFMKERFKILFCYFKGEVCVIVRDSRDCLCWLLIEDSQNRFEK